MTTKIFRSVLSTLLIISLSIVAVVPQPVYAVTDTLTITGEGTDVGASYYGGGWAGMNDCNGATSGWAPAGAGTLHSWDALNFSSTYLAVTGITVYTSAAATIPGLTMPFRIYVDVGGTRYYSSSMSTTDDGLFGTFAYTWSTNPATLTAWTAATIDAAFYGISGDGGNVEQFSCIYIEVNYTVPSAPSVTTTAATGIIYTGGVHKATLGGSVASTGGLTIDYYGFVWDTSDKGNPGNADPSVPPGTWASGWKSGVGDYGANTFSHQITGLIVNTTYYYRAAAHNSLGWVYGSALSFRTLKDPAITTVAASVIAATSARLNSTVVDDGGEDCTVVFVYKANAGAHYANYAAVLAAGGTEVTATGTYNTGELPYYDISGLTPTLNYDFAVKITNTISTQYGSVLYFPALSGVSAPTSVKAIPTGTTVSLLWVKGTGATTTYIRRKLGSYPTSNSDAASTLIYNSVEGSFQDTGLVVGTTYFYMFWGLSGTTFSSDNATVMATTLPTTTPAVTVSPLVAPSSWWTTSTPTVFNNLPIYGTVNWVWDTYAIPRATGWLIIALVFTILGGIAVYAFSHRLLVGVISVGGFFAMFAFMGMVPMWLVFVVSIFIIASVIVGTRL